MYVLVYKWSTIHWIPLYWVFLIGVTGCSGTLFGFATEILSKKIGRHDLHFPFNFFFFPLICHHVFIIWRTIVFFFFHFLPIKSTINRSFNYSGHILFFLKISNSNLFAWFYVRIPRVKKAKLSTVRSELFIV